MGGSTNLDFLRFLVLISFCLPLTRAAAETPISNICPMDLNYVLRIPWNKTLCRNFNPLAQNDNSNTTSKAQCCQAILSLFGVALSQHLKETSLFQLPDLATSSSCLQDYQSKLSSFSLSDNLVSHCFNPLQFVTSPNICARIETSQDWVAQLGKSTSLDSDCRSDLTDLTACASCVRAGNKVQSLLVAADGNQTHAQDCFYFAVLYAAGIVNEFGPESDGVVSCIFGLDLNSRVGSASNSHSALVFGLTGAGVAILLISSLLGLYLWYDKKWRRKKNPGFGFDLDEQQGSRPKLRPNTGSIWFKIRDLEKATDNFSQKNFIGRGGFGFVYKGVLSDGTVVAVKRVIESDFQGDAEFCNEVEIISNLKHRNLVPLRGCCVIDDDVNSEERGNQRYLVYDYMSNGNLDDHLFPSSDNQIQKQLLSWPQRKSIILDVAKGLAYLHHGVKPGIYHRDIKGTNIFDSSNSNPKGIMERFVLVGILCAHIMVALRPTILDALKMLEGDIEVPRIPDRPVPLGHPSFHADGNNFSISPVLSAPKLQPGDTLRMMGKEDEFKVC
ncbi:receptor-like protein kinase [Populus alba x Populus x berolinensis]|nr:receptor-like protein kinase [Populus alba x Populus x berolinensis]